MTLNKLPDYFIKQMNKEVNVDTAQFKHPIEAIMQEKVKTGQNPVPQNVPTIPMIEVDGFILPTDEITMFMYLLTTVLAKNPEVDSLLKKFHFKFNDVNGQIIYPKKQKKVKKEQNDTQQS
jgi:hypothetical protein